MVTRTLAVLALLAFAMPAHADSPKIDQARKAIDEVRFDEAQRLLVGALADGGNSPAAVREIYKLSASTAVVLGQREIGEQNYRRWLALDPAAAIGANVAPKLREPFEAAQAYIAAHGRLTATVTRVSASALDVAVTDPLSMAASATILGGTPVPLDTEHRARLTSSDAGTLALAVLDDRGNHLVELAAQAMPVPAITAVTPPLVPARPQDPLETDEVDPEGKRFRVWLLLAIPSAVLIVTGGAFAYAATSDQVTVDEAIAQSTTHNYSDVASIQSRATTFTAIGATALGLGALMAVPAVILYVRARNHDRAVIPVVSSESVGAAFGGRF